MNTSTPLGFDRASLAPKLNLPAKTLHMRVVAPAMQAQPTIKKKRILPKRELNFSMARAMMGSVTLSKTRDRVMSTPTRAVVMANPRLPM